MIQVCTRKLCGNCVIPMQVFSRGRSSGNPVFLTSAWRTKTFLPGSDLWFLIFPNIFWCGDIEDFKTAFRGEMEVFKQTCSGQFRVGEFEFFQKVISETGVQRKNISRKYFIVWRDSTFQEIISRVWTN